MNIKSQKKTLIIIAMFFLTIMCCIQTTSAEAFHSVKGVLYINDEIAPEGITIKLNFSTETNSTTTYVFNSTGDETNYNLGFVDHEGETGFFYVVIDGEDIEPNCNKTIYIEQGVTGYIRDLYITIEIPENHPPNKPCNPSPWNNSYFVLNNTLLSVDVTDPDGDLMNVSFYNAHNDELIGWTMAENGTTASIMWSNLSYKTFYYWFAVANDSELSNRSDEFRFQTLPEQVNHPPFKPYDPEPANNSENVSVYPMLRVRVSDLNNDKMDVFFYNASDDSLIGVDTGVSSSDFAEVAYLNVDYNSTYYWYAVANDSEFETKSDTWTFSTKKYENQPPSVRITKPNNAFYLFNFKIRPHRVRLRLPLIIGKITIEANATDEDSGIEKVEFYAGSKFLGNDTTEPYSCVWKRDGLNLIHIFKIKVVAYDFDGEQAEDTLLVRKYL